MVRTKEVRILSDEELKARSKNRHYDRRERLQDAITNIALIAVYVVPVVFVVLVVIVFIQLFLTNDFANIQRYMEILGAGIFGYLFAQLQRLGVSSSGTSGGEARRGGDKT